MSVLDQIESETDFAVEESAEQMQSEASSAARSPQVVFSLEKTDLMFIALLVQTLLLAYIAYKIGDN